MFNFYHLYNINSKKKYETRINICSNLKERFKSE